MMYSDKNQSKLRFANLFLTMFNGIVAVITVLVFMLAAEKARVIEDSFIYENSSIESLFTDFLGKIGFVCNLYYLQIFFLVITLILTIVLLVQKKATMVESL